MMEPRKASEIILSLENKIDILMATIKSMELNIKILSNKLNLLSEKIDATPREQPKAASVGKFEAVDMVPVEYPIEEVLEQNPQGFRRTSRPETYQKSNDILENGVLAPVQVPFLNTKIPVQPQINKEVEPTVVFKNYEEKVVSPTEVKIDTNNSQVIAVSQRVMDSTNKSLFLASVKVYNSQNDVISPSDLKTDHMGKWKMILTPGKYTVEVNKLSGKDRVELQKKVSIEITGKEKEVILPTLKL